MLNLLIYISMLILNQFLSVGLAVYNISAAVKIFSKYGPVHCFMIAWWYFHQKFSKSFLYRLFSDIAFIFPWFSSNVLCYKTVTWLSSSYTDRSNNSGWICHYVHTISLKSQRIVNLEKSLSCYSLENRNGYSCNLKLRKFLKVFLMKFFSLFSYLRRSKIIPPFRKRTKTLTRNYSFKFFQEMVLHLW